VQNIVITGCSTGIGFATANYLKAKGVKVYPTARKREDVERLRALGFEEAMLLDVREASHITHVIERVMEQDGRIDVWFNNAGFGQAGALEDIPTKALRAQFETNVMGLHEASRQLIPLMRAQGGGKIIQHSSVLGIVSLFGRGAYNASKYAVEGLSDTLRLELKGSGVFVSLLNTGPIESDFSKNAVAKLKENVDIEHSYFKEAYDKSLKGINKKVPFKEGANSVAEVVYAIMRSPKPKPRYYITKATYLLGYLKRILSTTLLDKILLKVA
jgi:short-subunit dehydrogenase